MKKTTLLILALMIALLSIGATAVEARENNLSNRDKEFIKEAVSGGLFEVKMGEAAQKQASSEKVKSFGQRMVTDHTKANDELMKTAQNEGFTPPGSMNKKDQRMYDKLSKLNGAEFDREYMKNMVSDHEKDIAAFKKESRKGKNVSVKQFSEKTIPTLEEHLRMAKDVLAGIKK